MTKTCRRVPRPGQLALLRKYRKHSFPKGMDFRNVSQAELDHAQAMINARHRKNWFFPTLKSNSSKELHMPVDSTGVLHFDLESSSFLSPKRPKSAKADVLEAVALLIGNFTILFFRKIVVKIAIWNILMYICECNR